MKFGKKRGLTALARAGGCGSKIGPEDLRKALRHMPVFDDKNFIYGQGTGDDAGVYKISDELAIVQSVDFFTPIVDDPYTFGKISAANALSDIYALGAKPISALNIIGISCALGTDVIGEILRGGAETVAEAGAVIVGGHSVDDSEPKYGLAVTGVVHPEKMITNRGARPGDAVVLTKKIGTGILSNLAKAGKNCPAGSYDDAIESMKRLNRTSAETMVELNATACTDVTGYGLLGHARNLAEASNVSISIKYSDVPKFDGIESFAIKATKGGGERNFNWVKERLTTGNDISREQTMVLCDAQTSGGLLVTLSSDMAEQFVDKLKAKGNTAVAIIGRVEAGAPGTISVY
ncbi:Selenide,water dikinase @ selenocysteine-containing [hydrothermal vent metagenome]|uniref:Selenide,water dikinase @ selenocysteine-containing n=1 Tax=hydrothermal vent metagenome TaxID=652676 RepID=A0A3B1CPF7_9ZZZZ